MRLFNFRVLPVVPFSYDGFCTYALDWYCYNCTSFDSALFCSVYELRIFGAFVNSNTSPESEFLNRSNFFTAKINDIDDDIVYRSFRPWRCCRRRETDKYITARVGDEVCRQGEAIIMTIYTVFIVSYNARQSKEESHHHYFQVPVRNSHVLRLVLPLFGNK